MRTRPVHWYRMQRWSYVAAVLLVGLTVVARWAVSGVMGERAICLSFLPAVALSAFIGGLGPGIVATVLGTLAADLLALHWYRGFHEITEPEVLQVVILLFTGLIVSGLSEAQRRAVGSRDAEMRARLRAEVRLTAEHAVTRILADSTTLEEAAPRILHAVRESLHAAAGLLWMPDVERRTLRCAFISTCDDERVRTFGARCREFAFARGIGLPGRVWASGDPAWIVDVVLDGNFPRARIAADADIHGGMGFPLSSGDDFFGVVEFFTDHAMAPDPALLNMMGAIGSEIGQFILRRRAEGELRRSQHDLADFVENATIGLQWVGPDGRIIWANKAELEMLGYERGDYVGHHIGEFHADQPVIDRILERLAQGQTFQDFAARLRCKDGSIKHVMIDSSVLFEAGAFVHTRCFTRDVTEQMRAERERDELLVRERQARAEAERASRAKDEFLGVLSHELRTPLTPVLLTVTLLENSPHLTADQRRDLQTIRRNVELEARLIDDLLDLTRISRGKLQLDMHTTDVHPLVHGAVDICQRTSGIRLVVDLAATRHFVRADPPRLQQVFWNLLNNAHKFTPIGGTVTVRSLNTQEGRIRVEIADTGVGIEPHILPRIFDAFEQGHGESRRFGGLGLGLAISRALVEAQGGRLWAHSDGRGRGATFSVELPVVRAIAPRPSEDSTHPAPDHAPARPLRILIVEDHEPTRDVMTKLLSDMGHRALAAGGLESALQLVRDNELDLVISDLGLPDGSGHDLMRQIRQRHLRGIALSGYGMEEDLRRSEEAGFSEHLIKPIDVSRLAAAIRRVTEQPAVA